MAQSVAFGMAFMKPKWCGEYNYPLSSLINNNNLWITCFIQRTWSRFLSILATKATNMLPKLVSIDKIRKKMNLLIELGTGRKNKMPNITPSWKNLAPNLVKRSHAANGRSSRPFPSLSRLGTRTSVEAIIIRWPKILALSRKPLTFCLRSTPTSRKNTKNIWSSLSSYNLLFLLKVLTKKKLIKTLLSLNQRCALWIMLRVD